MKKPNSTEFLVAHSSVLRALKPGEEILAAVRRQGREFVLENISAASGANIG